jgi:hypothetical protein
MPVFLESPRVRPGGPDGKGMNRLSLNANERPAHQCALRPRSYATLVESRNTPRARWGRFGRCTASGDCGACPRLTPAEPRELEAFCDRVLVRVRDSDIAGGWLGAPPPEAWVMNRPEDGWGSRGERWTWEELSALPGWEVGRHHKDEHGEGFWLIRERPAVTR